MKNKPCPFCGAELAQENRLNPLAKKYDDFAFRTFYVHPNNGCFLSNEPFREEKLKQWNTRMNGGVKLKCINCKHMECMDYIKGVGICAILEGEAVVLEGECICPKDIYKDTEAFLRANGKGWCCND